MVRQTEGPLLVVAGAGSGKTRVLTHRVAHLIADKGVKPNEILAITFTNKAAGEMRDRLTLMLGGTARAIWILTFHAACGRILRREAERLGYKSTFTIYDDQYQVRLTKACLEGFGKDPKRFAPRGIHSQISRMKNELVTPEEALARVASFCNSCQTVAETYDVYQRRLHASNAVDFDDLLMLTVQVLERFPDALGKWQKAFRYILVDEYQDTQRRAVPTAPATGWKARERLCGRRSGPVRDRGNARVDGRRHHEADRARTRWRRGPPVLRKRRVWSGHSGRRPSIVAPPGHRDQDRIGTCSRFDAGAHALRRVQDRLDAAAPYDVLDVETGSRVPGPNVANVHGRTEPGHPPAQRSA